MLKRGVKPSEETRAKMSAAKLGRKLSEETRGKISASRNNSICGRIPLEVIDTVTGEKSVYSSISDAASNLCVLEYSIRRYLSRNTDKPFKKKRYKISKN
jgi:hypothetical protein